VQPPLSPQSQVHWLVAVVVTLAHTRVVSAALVPFVPPVRLDDPQLGNRTSSTVSATSSLISFHQSVSSSQFSTTSIRERHWPAITTSPTNPRARSLARITHRPQWLCPFGRLG
jgi:hypothetical protein